MKKSLLFLVLGLVSLLTLGQTYTVTSNADSGPGTLRDGITKANTGAYNKIIFALNHNYVDTIRLKSRLPIITKSLIIDATTEQYFDTISGPKVALKYDSLNIFLTNIKCGNSKIYSFGEFSGLYVRSSSNSIKGLIFKGFSEAFNFDTIGQSNNNYIGYNVIIANIRRAFLLKGNNNTIISNRIGIDFNSTIALNGIVYNNYDLGYSSVCSAFQSKYSGLLDCTLKLIGDNNNLINNNLLGIMPFYGKYIYLKGNNFVINKNKLNCVDYDVPTTGGGSSEYIYSRNSLEFSLMNSTLINNDFSTTLPQIKLEVSNSIIFQNIFNNKVDFGYSNQSYINNNIFSGYIVTCEGKSFFSSNLNKLASLYNLGSGGISYGLGALVKVKPVNFYRMQKSFSGGATLPIRTPNSEPTILAYNLKGVDSTVINGTSISQGDTLHFYLSSNDTLNLKKYQYIKSAIVDNQGKWSVTLANTVFDSYTSLSFAAYRSDINGYASSFTPLFPYSYPCIVTTSADNGDNNNPTPGSLRAAIICANSKTERTEIKFKIDEPAPYQINITTSLPDIINSKGVLLDGSSQWTYLPSKLKDTISINLNSGISINVNSNNTSISNLKLIGRSLAGNLGVINIMNDSVIVSNCYIKGDPTGISIQNGNLIIKNNRILGGGATGIFIANGTSLIFNNYISSSFSDISISNGVNTIDSNFFIAQNQRENIFIGGGKNYVLKNKINNISGWGLNVFNGDNNIFKNEVLFCNLDGIRIIGGKNTLTSNFIHDNNTSKLNVYYGVSIKGGSNFIFQNKIKNNQNLQLGIDGVYKQKISQNIFNNSINNFKSINLINNGNNSKPASKLLSSSFQGKIYNLKGKSYPGDTIEVFLSNTTGNEASSYIARGVAKFDSTFTITLADSITKKGDFYVATTATDTAGNTSELSSPLHIVICNSCPCEVTNTLPDGEGSLAEAINCANNKQSVANIVFKIPTAGPYVIKPKSNLILSNPYGINIDGFSQTQIGTSSKEIIINNSLVILPTSGPNIIKNLTIGGFASEGVIVLSDSNNIINCKFTNLNKGVSMYGGAKGSVGRNTIAGNLMENILEEAIFSPEKYVDYNIIENNKINLSTNGIRIIQSNSNFIRNNIISKNDFNAISLMNSNHNFISGNVVEGLDKPNSNGIKIDGYNNQINNNNIGKFAYGIFYTIPSQYYDSTSGSNINGNTINSYIIRGIDILGNRTLVVNNSILNGDTINNQSLAIAIGGVFDTVSNNTIRKCRVGVRTPWNQGEFTNSIIHSNEIFNYTICGIFNGNINKVKIYNNTIGLGRGLGISIGKPDTNSFIFGNYIGVDSMYNNYPIKGSGIFLGNWYKSTNVKMYVNNNVIGNIIDSVDISSFENMEIDDKTTGNAIDIGWKMYNTYIENNYLGITPSGKNIPIKYSCINIGYSKFPSNPFDKINCNLKQNILSNSKFGVSAFYLNGLQLSENKFSNITKLINGIALQEINVKNNLFDNFTNGILLSSSPSYQTKFVNISQNIFLKSLNKPINLNLGTAQKANQGKPSPQSLTSLFQGNIFNFKGKSYPGDTIEVFLSNTTGNEASSYIARGVAKFDSTFTITLADSITKKGDFYVATTATDTAGNTSELSSPLHIVICNSCVCIVKNTLDAGTGSLRQAITDANTGKCSTIDFNIETPVPYKINLQTELPAITKSGLTIDGSSQWKYKAGNDTVEINGGVFKSFSSTALYFNSVQKLTIANLKINNFGFGVSFWNSDSITVSNNSIINCSEYGIYTDFGGNLQGITYGHLLANNYIFGSQNGVFLRIDKSEIFNNKIVNSWRGIYAHTGSNKIENNSIFNSSSNAIYLSSTSNNLLKSNIITNSIENGVYLSGNQNKLSGNQIYNNGQNAILLNSGANNNQPIPQILSHQINTNTVTLSGKANPGDSIQVFVNDGNKENALEFIPLFIKTGNDSIWTTTISAPYFKSGDANAYVATATDALGNTSQLSSPYKIGEFFKECVVVNNQDTGIGSLREAINTCANTSDLRAKIIFKQPSKLGNVINISAPLVLTNPKGIIIDAKDYDITIDGGIGSAYPCFVLQGGLNNISKLKINNGILGVLVNSKQNIISNNTLLGSNTAVSITNKSNIIQNNTIGNLTGIAVNISSSDSNIVQNNFIGLNNLGNLLPIIGKGIQILGSKNCLIQNNTLGNIKTDLTINSGVGIVLRENLEVNEILNNKFGIDANNVSCAIDSVCILAYGGSPGSGSSSQIIKGNSFNNALCGIKLLGGYNSGEINYFIAKNSFTTIDGIINKNGINNHFSQNTFTSTLPNTKAISNLNGSNNNKAIPQIQYTVVNATNWNLVGKSTPGDTVEIFKSTQNNQVASKYIGFAITGNDSIFKAVLSLADLDKTTKSYFVATATDVNRNTSELSNSYGFCEECVCLVKNTADSGANTLREAITLANNGECAQIKFNIPLASEYKIVLQTELPSFKRPVFIDGSSQTGYDINKTPIIELQAKDSTLNGLVADYYYANVKALYLNGFKSGVIINKSNNTFTNVVVGNSHNHQVIINGDNNSLNNSYVGINIENLSLTGKQSGVYVTGKSNNISFNNISNNGTDGIIVDKNSINMILNNTFTNNGADDLIQNKAISLINNGNFNQSVPTFSNNVVNANNIVIYGKATAGDKIQLFSNNNLEEEAVRFLAETITDAQNNWSITLPSNLYTQGQNNYFVATATASNKGTSPLTKVYQVGAFPVSCFVTNTKNTGKGSLRVAVACVNTAGTGSKLPAQIVFALPTNSENIITVYDNGFSVTNNYGVLIDPKNVPVTIKANTGVSEAFNWKTKNFTIQNLTFKDFERALVTENSLKSTIQSNKFENNLVAIKATANDTVSIQNNSIDGGNIAIWLNKVQGKIQGNLVGKTLALNSIGVYAQNTNGATITNNQIESVNKVPYQGIDTLLIGNSVAIQLSTNSKIENNNIKAAPNKTAIFIDNSTSLQINTNKINNGKNGIWVNASKNIALSKNVITDPALFGIYLSTTTNTNISENQVLGLTSVGKAIELQYGTSKESNKGKAIPKFKYASYKRGQLVIKGESQQNDKVEIFSTDVNGWDLKQHVSTVYTDDNGNFEYRFKVNPSDINTYNFKATATISNWITNDTVYTSEASEKFNPNLKLCFVTNTDNAGKGSLRANIDSANIDRCNLMLFEITGNAPYTITPVSDLPIITAKELTIDATSQEGFVNNAVVFVKDNLNATNALEINSLGVVSVHGLGYDGYTKTVKITKVTEFEQTLNLVKNYRTNPFEFVSKKHKSINIDSNSFESSTSKIGLKLNTPNIKLSGNELSAGTDTALAIVSDSLLVVGNTISSKSFRNEKYAVFVGKIDSLKLQANIISDYHNGILIEKAKNALIVDNILNTSIVSTLGYTRGIRLINSAKVKLQGNFISRSDSSIVINNNTDILVQGNIIDSTKTDGISVIKSPRTKLQNNTISKAKNGIKFIDSKQSQIIDNTIFEFQNAGVINDSLSTALTIQKNVIGARFTTLSTINRGVGIALLGDSSLVGGDTSVANYIFNNTLGGVMVYGKYNKIVGNSIYDNDTSSAQPVNFAIKHIKFGNDLKSKPVIDSFKTVVKNAQFTVYGTSTPNDTIHVYRADGVYQNAKYYVNKTIADASGKWTIAVDTAQLFPKLEYQTLTLVATATDALNNTSELSNMLYVGACFVKNQVDVLNNQYPAPNSFRQAVQCANKQHENTDIYFALDQNTSSPILLSGEMLTLTNKYGVVFNAKNLLLDKNNVNVGYGATSESTKFSTFWKIDSLVGASQFKYLNIENFDTAFVLNVQKKPVVVQGFEFKNINKNAIVLGNNTTKTTISNSKFKTSPTATYISAIKKSDSLTIKNTSFINGKTAISLANASNTVIKFDTLSALESNIIVSKSSNIDFNNSQIDLVNSKSGVLFTEVSGAIRENKFKGITPLSIFEISKSTKLYINENIQEDECLSFASVQKSSESVFYMNVISKAKKAFIVDSCQRIKVIHNNLNYVSDKALDAKRSDRISFNYNTVKNIDTIVKPINIYLDDVINVSNNAHPDPVVLGYNVKKAKEGDCNSDETRLSIFLNGTSLPNDSIEIYFSDTIRYALKEFVVKGRADKTGKWDILIPRYKYIKDSKWYHFIVTATDSLGNTSQTSNKYSFGKVVNQIIVKNTNNTGSYTLRDAIEKVNCSNVYSNIRFEINDENLHEIILNDSLPKISAYLGFTMDGGTQKTYAISSGIKFANQQIIIKTANNATKYPVFTLAEGCDTSTVKSIHFNDCQKGLQVLNNHNKFEQLHFVNTNATLSDTAITLVKSSENVFKKCNISGYKIGTCFTQASNDNKFITDTLKNVKVAYLFNELSTQNVISTNSIITDSIAVIFNQTASVNLLQNNTFGSVQNAIKYPSVYFKNASRQVIQNNKFLWGDVAQDADSAFIVIKGKSNGNIISTNKFGVDKNHDFVKTSNMKAVWVKPSNIDSLPNNNVIVNNEIVGINNVAIQVDSALSVNINDNYIGIDSLFKGKDPLVDDYKAVKGVQREGVLITASSNIVVNNNVIINYGTHGVNARKSSGVLVEKNKIFSENTTNKAINLNHENSLLATNISFAKPQITDGDAVDINTISLSGTSPTPNVNVLIYEAFADSAQSLRYIKTVQADASGNWIAQMPSSNFGFNKFNNYIAQISSSTASSEYSKNYRLSPPLCKLAGKIDLFEDKYTPCPGSQFTLDATLPGLDYEWKNAKITTITTQKAQLDSSGVYTLTLKDKFNCSITETFEVAYKPKPAEPIFIVSSGIYVGDTITIVDISPNRPSSFDWSSNDNIDIVSTASSSNITGPDGKVYPGGREVKFIVPDTGSYTITQRSKLNDCFVKVDKTVIATYKDPTVPNPYLLAPVIQGIVVYPVPVKKGTNANAFITTTSEEPVYISVVNMLGNEKLTDTFDGKLRYNIPLKLDSLSTGVYIIRLETETQTLSYKIVIID